MIESKEEQIALKVIHDLEKDGTLSAETAKTMRNTIMSYFERKAAEQKSNTIHYPSCKSQPPILFI